MAQHVQDDAFREIQLNGKQLVFLFMVATVVSVVIFLCGVFVGRGVRTELGPLLSDASGASPVTTPDILASQEPAPTPAGSDPTAAAPPPAVDELSYFNRLDSSAAPAEELKPSAAAAPPAREKGAPIEPAASVGKSVGKPVGKPVAPPAPAPAAAARSATPPPAPAPAAAKPAVVAPASAAEPSGEGFALQIAALRERHEAESIAKRLAGKGYEAYVLAPAKGAPSIYRVRIGKFKTRREAEAIATRLQKEEQFTPWITR